MQSPMIAALATFPPVRIRSDLLDILPVPFSSWMYLTKLQGTLSWVAESGFVRHWRANFAFALVMRREPCPLFFSLSPLRGLWCQPFSPALPLLHRLCRGRKDPPPSLPSSRLRSSTGGIHGEGNSRLRFHNLRHRENIIENIIHVPSESCTFLTGRVVPVPPFRSRVTIAVVPQVRRGERRVE